MKSSTPTTTSQAKSTISFSKYTGCGNDFILIDNRDKVFPEYDTDLINQLCDRQYGVGADGVILLEKSSQADHCMRIFNSDGSEAEMCGNGIRCLGRYLHELQIPGTRFSVVVMDKIYSLVLHDNNQVSVTMLPPLKSEWNIELSVDEIHYSMDFLDTGVPHTTLNVTDIQNFDLEALGPKIRYHSHFNPQGTNFNLYQIDSKNPSKIRIRTYERGVERETMACGTGATACAIVVWKKYDHTSPINVNVSSGETIEFQIEAQDNEIQHIIMKGPAEFIFRGSFSRQNTG